ncbi:MAG: endonuclease/exonuclease/phosphatase family protein [Chloroflexi bacterium]|nr:endonuclease/exonuclease/phosphatase family protein [Chloroflexota bacterium]
MTDRVRVATLNIRNLADRWDERLPLLLSDTAAVAPDLLGLQEVVYVLQQDRVIGAGGPARYREVRGWAGRPEYGNSLLVREPLSFDGYDRLDLGLGRSAHRVLVALPGGATVLMAVTHLHHEVPDAEMRDVQAASLIDWLDGGPPATAQVVVGDFNAEPDEPASVRMREAGFRSALFEANGAEPDVTWPSGLQAPAMDTDGDPGCLDYIWIRGAVAVEAARVAWDRPAVDDRTLYPSDHLGLVADLVVG